MAYRSCDAELPILITDQFCKIVAMIDLIILEITMSHGPQRQSLIIMIPAPAWRIVVAV